MVGHATIARVLNPGQEVAGGTSGDDGWVRAGRFRSRPPHSLADEYLVRSGQALHASRPGLSLWPGFSSGSSNSPGSSHSLGSGLSFGSGRSPLASKTLESSGCHIVQKHLAEVFVVDDLAGDLFENPIVGHGFVQEPHRHADHERQKCACRSAPHRNHDLPLRALHSIFPTPILTEWRWCRCRELGHAGSERAGTPILRECGRRIYSTVRRPQRMGEPGCRITPRGRFATSPSSGTAAAARPRSSSRCWSRRGPSGPRARWRRAPRSATTSPRSGPTSSRCGTRSRASTTIRPTSASSTRRGIPTFSAGRCPRWPRWRRPRWSSTRGPASRPPPAG